MFLYAVIPYSFLIILCCYQVLLQPQECDSSIHSNLKEGNLGDIRAFPWLGVLRVHVHDVDEDESFKVALTGLVLIKKKYGVVNADDVARVNPTKIKREGKAMFIVKDSETLFCNVKEYSLHPEYEYATYNTIALVELADDCHDQFIPICWPDYRYNTSNQLYVLGYTDENMFLEKIMYKIQYISNDLCDEFYSRIGFRNNLYTPTYYHCGFAENNKKNCKWDNGMVLASNSTGPWIFVCKILVNLYTPTYYHCGFAENNKKNCKWDNGMVLASNSTGPWIFIGFGIKGSSCAAPSRFIDISQYLPWIQSSTDEVF